MHRHPWFSIALVLGIVEFHLPLELNAATLVVEQDGSGDATTINAALEMLDYNDGEDDVVLIGPGVYDEQIKPKGNAGVDSTAYPKIFEMTLEKVEAAYSSHPDHLTLEGIDNADPPVITIRTANQEFYGFFPNYQSDSSKAGLLFCGNGVTYQNIEIRPSGSDGYVMTGQASDIVFEDCLFTNAASASSRANHYAVLQNSSDLTSILNATLSADNNYTFRNCHLDGRSNVDGSLYDQPLFWFNGYPDRPELANADRVGGVNISGCIFRNWEGGVHEFRGRTGYATGLAFTMIEDCYFENVERLFQWRGSQGPGVFNRNVVKGVRSRGYAIRFRERFQAMPSEMIVANNIFMGGGPSDGGVMEFNINDNNSVPGNNPSISVINNSFVHYSGNGILIQGTSPRGKIVVANNIFSDADLNSGRYGVKIENPNLHVEVLNNMFSISNTGIDGRPSLDQGNVYGNALFNSTGVTIPNSPGETIIQGMISQSLKALGGGDISIYDSIRPLVGNLDVDGDMRETHVIDIGAQFIGEIPPTPTATQTPTPTATPTPTNPPPSAPTVIIEPEEPFTFDDLICNATWSVDPDGGDVTYLYKWFRDGVDLTIENETDFSGSTVPSEQTTRDEVWRCDVTVEDDEGKQNYGSAEVTIQNSLPTQPEIKVLPPNPLPGDGRAVLLLTFSIDADNDGVVYLFQWFRLDSEGEWQLRPEVSGTLQPYSPGQAEISGLYTAGETWKVEVTPYEARSLVKRNNDAKGSSGVIAGLTAVEQWIVLPDFGNDGMIDSADILILLELWRSQPKVFAPETFPDLILISTLGWQGKAEGEN